MSDNILAKVTAYKHLLVIELLATSSGPNCATSLDREGLIGQTIMDTEKYLGVSQEALDLLAKVKKGNDGIGDLMWFDARDPDGNSQSCFGWLGGPFHIISPDLSMGDRNFKIGPHVTIPNDTAQGAKDCIDEEFVEG